MAHTPDSGSGGRNNPYTSGSYSSVSGQSSDTNISISGGSGYNPDNTRSRGIRVVRRPAVTNDYQYTSNSYSSVSGQSSDTNTNININGGVSNTDLVLQYPKNNISSYSTLDE